MTDATKTCDYDGTDLHESIGRDARGVFKYLRCASTPSHSFERTELTVADVYHVSEPPEIVAALLVEQP